MMDSRKKDLIEMDLTEKELMNLHILAIKNYLVMKNVNKQ